MMLEINGTDIRMTRGNTAYLDITPLFNYISPNRFGRSAFWTRTLASGGTAIRINNNGIRGVATKTSELGVRPCMIFG